MLILDQSEKKQIYVTPEKESEEIKVSMGVLQVEI